MDASIIYIGNNNEVLSVLKTDAQSYGVFELFHYASWGYLNIKKKKDNTPPNIILLHFEDYSQLSKKEIDEFNVFVKGLKVVFFVQNAHIKEIKELYADIQFVQYYIEPVDVFQLKLGIKQLFDELKNKNELINIQNAQTNQQNALEESEYHYRIIADNVPDMIFIFNCKGHIVDYNRAVTEQLRYPEEEIFTFKPAKNDSSVYIENFAQIIRNIDDAQDHLFFATFRTLDQLNIPCELRVKKIDYKGQKSILLIARDISEHLKAQAELKKLSIAVEQSPVSIIITNKSGEIEYFNATFSSLTGYKREEIIGKNPSILKSGYHNSEFYEKIWETILHKKSWKGELLNQKKNGELFWERATISPITNNRSEITHFLAIKEDITLEKAAKERLLRAHQQLKTIFDTIPGEIVVVDKNLRILDISNKLLEIYHFDLKHKAIGKNFCEVVKDIDSNCSKNVLQEVISTGIPVEQMIDSEEEKLFGKPYKFYVSPIKNDKGEIWGAINLMMDVSDMKQKEEELISAKLRAETANKAKSTFIANMSHEIRTPLNVILGFTEMLREKLQDEIHLLEYLNSIETSGRSLLNLINDILDLSKIEADRLEIKNQPVKIRTLINEIKQIFTYRTNQKRLEFSILVHNQLPDTLVLDEIRLRQILFNLVGNAVKFTNNGYVKLIISSENISDSELDMIVKVKDSGIGISNLDQQKIFEPFVQKTGSSQKKFEGTGLGLAITRRLVEIMNGEISLDSEPGKGSEFKLLFPHIQYLKSSQSKRKEDKKERPDFKGAKVLIVDDLKTNRVVMRNYIRDFGVAIIEAEDGQTALQKLNENPDLVIMDIVMPVIDGIETTKKIREDGKFKDIPVIAVTASAFAKFPPGLFNDRVIKPVTREQILDVLKQNLKYSTTVISEKTPRHHSDSTITILQEIENGAFPEEVLRELSSLSDEFKQIQLNLSMDEIEEFGGKITHMLKMYEQSTLHAYANELIARAKIFDIEKLIGRLPTFQTVLEHISLKLNSMKNKTKL